MTSDLGPLYTHDCERCTFLGRSEPIDWRDTHRVYDFYFCRELCEFPTVVARYGSNGTSYTSTNGLDPSIRHPALIEAAKRARERGLLPGEPERPARPCCAPIEPREFTCFISDAIDTSKIIDVAAVIDEGRHRCEVARTALIELMTDGPYPCEQLHKLKGRRVRVTILD